MIGIRADANMTVASGHVMRCISIAKELNKCGEDVIFFTADHEADELLNTHLPTARHVVLDSSWDDLESELPTLIECIQIRKIDILLVDSYKVTYDYMLALSRVCMTAYIDDLHDGIYPVDMLINYNGYHFLFDYGKDYSMLKGHLDNQTKLLLGLDYAPLREQFVDAAAKRQSDRGTKSDNNTNILLSSGGGDSLHVLTGVIESALNTDWFETCSWHLIAGIYSSDRTVLEEYSKKYSNIILHSNVENMAELMTSCDIGITAAGTMITECAASGLPSIFYLSADNQRYEVTYWDKDAKMIYAGDMINERENTIKKIISSLEYLINNRKELSCMSLTLSNLVDGHGCKRIAEELITLCEQQ